MIQKVNENKQRDELMLYRLSSFFYREGKLEIQRLFVINPHVIQIATKQGENFILKGQRKKSVVEQQWDFLEKMDASIVVPLTNYPNGRRIIEYKNNFWTIAPYIKGEKLNYSNKNDRKTAVLALNDFHDKATGIYVSRPVKRDLFIIRWYQRLHSFKKTEHLFVKYGFKHLYRVIVQTMEAQLLELKQFPWHYLEKEALQKGSWVHGDVASHNFIRNEQVYMIDFDLLDRKTQVYDYIQLGQRFLPYINWDMNELLSYQMTGERDIKPWLTAILVPSDLLREWLYYLKGDSPTPVYEYLRQMEISMTNRVSFLKKAKSVLKSI